MPPTPPTPPPLAEALLASLGADPALAEAMLGDLAEERAARARRDGDAAARRWYRRQALHAVRPLLASAVRTLAPRAALQLAGTVVATATLLFVLLAFGVMPVVAVAWRALGSPTPEVPFAGDLRLVLLLALTASTLGVAAGGWIAASLGRSRDGALLRAIAFGVAWGVVPAIVAIVRVADAPAFLPALVLLRVPLDVAAAAAGGAWRVRRLARRVA